MSLSLLHTYLEQFQHECSITSHHDATLTNKANWVWHYDGGAYQFHVGASVMIHGNEVGPLSGVLAIIQALHQQTLNFGGQFTCFIGNVEASLQNKRFLDEDLNRVFTVLNHPCTHEQKRAQQLLPLLDSFDLYVDFHQTILDVKKPFYICPWQADTWSWMRIMEGAKDWITRHPSHQSGGFLCADEYVRQQGKVSCALELGALGFSSAAHEGVYRSLTRVYEALDQMHLADGNLQEMAAQYDDLSFYQTTHRIKFDDPYLQLRSGLLNFDQVQAGDVLSSTDSSKPLIAPADGAILFPKYPPRDEDGRVTISMPKEIYRIVSPLAHHPKDVW